MLNFIKVPALAQTSAENDSVSHIRTDTILEIRAATVYDRKQRKEINSLVICSHGVIATTDNAATILEKLKQSELNAPLTTD
jgi:hypothetical protein